MQIKAINEEFAVATQIQPGDVMAIQKAGYKSLICNRPDGETAGQPCCKDICELAQSLAMECRYLPVLGGQITDVQTKEFKRIMEDLPKPILAYCRTGTRSVTLWALSKANTLSQEQILSQAKQAGYDLSKSMG